MIVTGTMEGGCVYGYDAEDPTRGYEEYPDGYRLIFDLETYEYIGRYNPNLNEVI